MSYCYSEVDELEDQPVVGTHQCVALVQKYAGAPVTSAWRQGEAVLGNQALKKGTAIATFVNGRYPSRSHGNHAALFVKAAGNGIWIMDQWKSESKTTISLRFLAPRGKNRQGQYIRPTENAEAYSVIE
jgi:hypothetical protein